MLFKSFTKCKKLLLDEANKYKYIIFVSTHKPYIVAGKKILEMGDSIFGERTSFLRPNILENGATPTPVAFGHLRANVWAWPVRITEEAKQDHKTRKQLLLKLKLFRAFVRMGAMCAITPVNFEKELQMATMDLGILYMLAPVD